MIMNKIPAIVPHFVHQPTLLLNLHRRELELFLVIKQGLDQHLSLYNLSSCFVSREHHSTYHDNYVIIKPPTEQFNCFFRFVVLERIDKMH
jgi:hypothetical protein